MKKFVFLFIIFCLGLSYNSNAVPENGGNNPQGQAECIVPRQIPEGEAPGTLMWDPDSKDCVDIGLDCEYVPCPETKIVQIYTVEDGYLLTSSINKIKFNLKDSTGNWSVYTRQPGNYTFKDYEAMDIGICPDFPFLSHLRIVLNGITTDSQGNFEVRVPKP